MTDDSPPPLTALSLCSGIGGLDLAVHEILGARVVGYVERDAYAQAVLLARMEDEALEPAPIFSDLQSFYPVGWGGRVDLVFGGPPCQPYSAAGHKRRDSDPRDLTEDFLRVVGTVGPSLVFLENVRRFICPTGLGRVLGELASLGFDAEWGTLSACVLGAPHPRERVFVLAYTRRGAEMWLESRRGSGADGQGKADALRASPAHGWQTKSPSLGVADGLPREVDRLRALGNAVVPAQAAAALKLLLSRIE
jgi:DNA (cytosine-5)-methyltransferase 1